MQTPLSHARELHSFFCFLSDLQKQKYLLANYEGPESSYWVHISLTLISEWMAASLVPWLAFKHADCWASLDLEFVIWKKNKSRNTKQKTLHKHFWDVTGLIFPFFCKLSLWKRTCTSSTLCHHKQLGSLDFISKATTQRTLDLSQPSNFHTCTRGQPSFKSATEEKICLHFHILTWGKEKKKKRERKAWNVLRLTWQLG